MKVTLTLDLPGLERRRDEESKEDCQRRKRFKKAMRDLHVEDPAHLIPILEGLLAANAVQLSPDDLVATSGDWNAPDTRVSLVAQHAERASILSGCLAVLLERHYMEAE